MGLPGEPGGRTCRNPLCLAVWLVVVFFFFYVSDVVVVVVRKDFGASGSLDMGIVRGLGSLMAVYGGEEEVFGFWRLVRYVV